MDKIEIGGKEYTLEEIQALTKAGVLNIGQKHDVFAAANQAQLPHGYNQFDTSTGGLFTRPGSDPNVFSAMRRPQGGLLARLLRGSGGGIRKSVILDPEYSILTGVTDIQGATNEECGDAPTAGFAKLCTTRAAFGKFRAKNERFDISGLGGRINNADMDMRFIGLSLAENPLIPDVLARATNPNSYLGLSFMRFGVAAERDFSRVIFDGLAGTKSGFFFSEFNGFDQILIENPVDLESGNICTAASSLIVNRASVPVTSTDNNIVTQVGGMWRRLQRRAVQIFGTQADIGLSMHPDLFEALSRIWAQSYYTEGQIGASDSTPINNYGRENVDVRDQMRQGSYLLIRGVRVPVYQDDGIELTQSGNGFDSDIYFIPFSVMGTPTTYMEAFDMGNNDISEVMEMLPNGTPRILNNGLYMTLPLQTGECFEFLFIAKPRLIVRTPYLGGRLTNINFALDDYQDSPYVNEPYYVDGGRYLTSESLPYYSGDE